MSKKGKELISLINQNQKIKRYQDLEKVINENEEISNLLEDIKETQQQMINAKHIENTSIYDKYKKHYDELLSKTEDIPLLDEYLALQSEINEVLSYVTETIEEGIEKELQKEAKNKGENG